MKEIIDMLMEQQDKKYCEFQSSLIPGKAQNTMIGVRTPALRKLAKEISNMDICEAFLQEVPHNYFEENQLHIFVISEYKDFLQCVQAIEDFLPYIDNWATCDQSSPKVFKKHKEALMPYIEKWMASKETYTIRYGIRMLMNLFLDEDFKPEYLQRVCAIKSEEYYVNMMIAWYLATALAKQWEATVKVIESKCLAPWVQNKAIQKACESFRVSDEHKTYLRTLKL